MSFSVFRSLWLVQILELAFFFMLLLHTPCTHFVQQVHTEVMVWAKAGTCFSFLLEVFLRMFFSRENIKLQQIP